MSCDSMLPGLEQALDPHRMRDVVARAAGIPSEDVARFACTPMVIARRDNGPCTIRYALLRADATDPVADARFVFGKVYARRRQATRAYERTNVLRESGLPSIPACLMLVHRLRLMLQQCVDGEDLRDRLGTAEAHKPIVDAAQWLSRLHAAAPLPGLKQTPVALMLEKTKRRWGEIEARLASEGSALRRAGDGLAEIAGSLPGHTAVMLHKDYHQSNVLWDGKRIWIVDFDRLGLGDPALDLGCFLAHLEYQAYRQTGRVGSFAELEALFLETYRSNASSDPRPRLPFYRACAFLKLAGNRAQEQQGEWRQSVRTLVALAQREVENGLARRSVGRPCSVATS